MTSSQKDPAALIQTVDNAVTRVRTRALDVSFNELFDMYKSKELIIDPDFQRLFRWSETKQSQFIESLVLELPIPPIYVIEIEDGIYELIDGLQRISSYFHFRGMNAPDENEEEDKEEAVEQFLSLQGCDVLPELNDVTYDSLPQALQIKLKRHFIRMEVLRRETDPHLRYHMFKRLNTGGELLSRQEVRNCTIRLLDDRFVEFLKELAKDEDYVKCMSQLTVEKREKMYMEEWVLRFFAFKNNGDAYVKEIDEFLTSYMESVSDPDSTVTFDFNAERQIFKRTFSSLGHALGKYAFSSYNDQEKPREQFSSTHFEAFTIGIQKVLARVPEVQSKAFDKFSDGLVAIKTDPGFRAQTTGGGKNYARALKRRIQFVEEKLEECLQ